MAENQEPRPIVPVEDVAHRYKLEERRMSLEAGWNVPTYIAGSIALLFTVACILSLFFPTNISPFAVQKVQKLHFQGGLSFGSTVL